LRERLGIDDIALVLQQNRLCWYGHVLQKEDDDWVKKCMEYEVESPRPRGRPKKTRVVPDHRPLNGCVCVSYSPYNQYSSVSQKRAKPESVGNSVRNYPKIC